MRRLYNSCVYRRFRCRISTGQTTTRWDYSTLSWVDTGTRNLLSTNNYEFVRQMDYALQSDREISLQDVTDSTTRGGERRDKLDANERAQDLLQNELDLPLDERRDGRTDRVIKGEVQVLQAAHDGFQNAYNDEVERASRRADYLNYVMIRGTNWEQKPTTTFGECREVQMVSKHYDSWTTLHRKANAT